MERALVVVGPTDASKDLVREAGVLAEGVDADLVTIHVTTHDEYSARRHTMESIANTATSYTSGEAKEGATQFADDLSREILSEFDVDYEAVGALGDKGDQILDAAERYDCDHIFLPGRQRSPTGKALFGDTAQRVILDFDGPVTVVTE